MLGAITTTNTGCNIDDLAESMDEARETIRLGIDKVVKNSEDWQTIVVNDILPFIDTRLVTTIDALQNLVTKALQDAQSGAACVSDQIGPRVVNGLNRIVSNIDGQRRVDFVQPFVCLVSPTVLNLNLPVSNRPKVEVSGFDFIEEKSLQLFLEKNGKQTPVIQNRFARANNYRFVVDASKWDDTPWQQLFPQPPTPKANRSAHDAREGLRPDTHASADPTPWQQLFPQPQKPSAAPTTLVRVPPGNNSSPNPKSQPQRPRRSRGSPTRPDTTRRHAPTASTPRTCMKHPAAAGYQRLISSSCLDNNTHDIV